MEDFLAATRLNELIHKKEEDEKNKNTLLWVLAIIGAVAAIAGLTVAFVGLYKNNPKFKAFVDGIVKGAKQVAENVGKFFGQALKAIGDFFKGQTKWQKDFRKCKYND